MSAKICFDEEAFVADHVSGGLTIRQLAERYGLSYSLVEKILRGQRRPAIARRIDEAFDRSTGRLARQLTHLGGDALGALDRAMKGKAMGAAVLAAREVLSRVLGDKPGAEPLPRRHPVRLESEMWKRTLADLSPSTKLLVLEELGGPLEEGGPEDDPDDDPPPQWLLEGS